MAPSTINDPSNIGNVLLDLGLLTKSHLEAAVRRQNECGDTQLGEVLKLMGVITDVDLEAALKVQSLLRKGEVLAAHLAVLEFQTHRIDRSVRRQNSIVDAGMAAMDRDKYHD